MAKCDTNKNNLSLVVWFDGAAFKKTGNAGKVWSMMAMIVDLGPNHRNYVQNIITIFHIGKNIFYYVYFLFKTYVSVTHIVEVILVYRQSR